MNNKSADQTARIMCRLVCPFVVRTLKRFSYDVNDYYVLGLSGLESTIAHIVATTPELIPREESVESAASTNNNRKHK